MSVGDPRDPGDPGDHEDHGLSNLAPMLYSPLTSIKLTERDWGTLEKALGESESKPRPELEALIKQHREIRD